MAIKPTGQQDESTPQGVSSEVHLDDFLNVMHDKIHGAFGQVHVESLTAFAKAKKAAGVIKQTEETWLKDYENWMNALPE